MHPLKRLFRPLLLMSYGDAATLANGLIGLLAITYALDGQRRGVDGSASFLVAMLLLLVAVVTDGLDGYLVRRFGTKHEYGAYLDSISDAVSFCLAPAVLIYALWYDLDRGPALDLLTDNFAFDPRWNPANLAAMIGALAVGGFGLLRLARFSHSRENRLSHFSGMPTPSMTVFALLVALKWSPALNDYTGTWPPLLLGVAALTMMSTIPFPKARGRMMVPILASVLFLLATVVLRYYDWEHWVWFWTVAFLLDAAYIVGSPLCLLRFDPYWRGEA